MDDALNKKNKILIKAKSLELLSLSALYYKDFDNVGYKKLSNDKQVLFKKIKEFLDNNLNNYYSMEYVANKYSISLSSLKNLFYDVYGISPYTYHLNRRLEKAKIMLEETDYKVNYIYKETGFNYHSNFSKAFQKKYDCSPSQYRKKKKSYK